jgi:uncharacterized protein (TIGR03032 family)
MSLSDTQPLSCTFTANVGAILNELQCSLALTTYQAGKLIFISAAENGTVQQLPRDFKRAMGLAVDGKRMAVATDDELVVLANAPGLAATYPNKPNFYDQFYVPRATYYTGAIELHDIGWDNQGCLWGVNTLFSSLVQLNDQYSFEPKWVPPFIEQQVSEDYCHLNGMAMVEGYPRYVTMFGKTNTAKGWRAGIQTGGLIMDISNNQIVAEGLAMPHSPRWINGALYCLLSAKGELVKINTATGQYNTISKHNGFVRGLAQYGDYLFIGLSKNRQQASVQRNLPVADTAMECGIDILHLPTASIAGSIRYVSSAEEIYDVQVLPFAKRPGILNHTNPIHHKALHTPTACYWAGE